MDPPSYTLEFEKPLRDLARQLDELRQQSIESNVDTVKEIRSIEKKIETTQREIYSNLTPWQKVQLARHPKRPYALDYVSMICKGFQELHGDRQFNDDRALVGGTAFFDGQAVMIVAQQKGRDPKERIARNFGMPQPEGYRKALRIMKMAEKFRIPVLSFIDTPGAFPGVGSEERHVSEAIAVNLREMAMLRTPTISVVARPALIAFAFRSDVRCLNRRSNFHTKEPPCPKTLRNPAFPTVLPAASPISPSFRRSSS